MEKPKKIPNKKEPKPFLHEEFAQEIFDEKAKVGYAPITGGLITRGLVEIGEEILAAQDKPEH